MTVTAAIADVQKGRYVADIAMKPPKAPRIMRSPCAKVVVSVALLISTKPSAVKP